MYYLCSEEGVYELCFLVDKKLFKLLGEIFSFEIKRIIYVLTDYFAEKKNIYECTRKRFHKAWKERKKTTATVSPSRGMYAVICSVPSLNSLYIVFYTFPCPLDNFLQYFPRSH